MVFMFKQYYTVKMLLRIYNWWDETCLLRVRHLKHNMNIILHLAVQEKKHFATWYVLCSPKKYFYCRFNDMACFKLFMNAKFLERLKKTKQHTLDYVSHKYSLSSIKEAGVLNISTDWQQDTRPAFSLLSPPSFL